jgi:hypothetical protein
VAGVNRAGRHRRVLVLFTILFKERRRSGVGDREQEMGVLWSDKGRNSQRHIRSRVSPCSTVVKRGYRSRRKVRR